MSESIATPPADDLVRLWQDVVLPVPSAEQLASRIGSSVISRFDRTINFRNRLEYAGFIALLFFAGLQWLLGRDRIQAVMMVAAGGFVMAYLWWQHRRLIPLDPSADGRAYQAALLKRIDHQIRLLRTVRYWYLLPLYLPTLRQAVVTWPRSPVAAVVIWLAVTATFAAIAWLNERAGVAFLEKERMRVDAIYREGE